MADMKSLVEDKKAMLRRFCSDGKGEGTSEPPLVIGEESLCRTRPYYFRRCKRVRPTNIESLPCELLSDILVRLPADYLNDRARLVCRRWYHIIRSDAFVNKQIQHSTYGLLLSCSEKSGGHPIFMTATQGRVEISELSYESKTSLSNGCNGLALERGCSGVNICPSILLITNPATKQSLVLPPLQLDTHKELCCIAFAASSMKYKLVIPCWTSGRLLFILTFGVDNSWRNVEIDHVSQFVRPVLHYPAFLTEGFIHWAPPMGVVGVLLTMDVETEIVSMRRMPRPRGNIGMYHLSTGRFLSMLVAFRDFLWEIWGMNSETGEWRKVLPDIKLGGLLHEFAATGKNEALGALLHKYSSKGKDEVLVPLGWVKYPEVLAFRLHFGSRTCILYNRETHEINSTELPYPCECYSRFAHKNSVIRLA